jgi:hypothetical protein
MLSLKLSLAVNLGDGYISGTANLGQKSFKINIQESLENKLVFPDDLQIDSGPGKVLFETEKNEEVLVKCKILDEPIDRILVYIDIQALMKLSKDLPTTMSINSE